MILLDSLYINNSGEKYSFNVIVGAGSVVRGKIPSDSVIIGNPASVIGSTKDQAEKWKSKIGTINTRQD